MNNVVCHLRIWEDWGKDHPLTIGLRLLPPKQEGMRKNWADTDMFEGDVAAKKISEYQPGGLYFLSVIRR